MSDKIIKVAQETHLALKVGASNQGVSMREFIADLSDKNVMGIPFDVENYGNDAETLIAVFQDISNYMRRIKNNLTDEEIEDWKNTVLCVNDDTNREEW